MSETNEVDDKTVVIPPGAGLETPGNAPRARLVCTDATLLANESAREIRLHEATARTLGRSEEADIVIKAEGVSRKHARLLPSDGAWDIEDLRSRNGVRVNARAVERARLQPGDVIEIGPVHYRYAHEQETPAVQAPELDLTGTGEKTLILSPAERAAAAADAGKGQRARAKSAAQGPRPSALPLSRRASAAPDGGTRKWLLLAALLVALVGAALVAFS